MKWVYYALSLILLSSTLSGLLSVNSYAQSAEYEFDFVSKSDIPIHRTYYNTSATQIYSSSTYSYTSDEIFYLVGRAAGLLGDQELIDTVTGADWYTMTACDIGSQNRIRNVCLYFGNDQDNEIDIIKSTIGSTQVYNMRTTARPAYKVQLSLAHCTGYKLSCSGLNDDIKPALDDTLFSASFTGLKNLSSVDDRYHSSEAYGHSMSYENVHYQTRNASNVVSYQHRMIGSTQTVNYPIDYDGALVENIDDNTYRPRLTFTVIDKKISGTIRTPENTPFIGDQWHKAKITITDPITDTELYTHINNTDGVVFEYEFDNYGDYQLKAEFLPPSPPYHYPDRTYKPLIIDPLVINGKNYTMYSEDLECDGDTCTGINDQNTSPIQRALADIERDMHGLQAIIYAPIAFATSLPARAGTCNPITTSINGQSISIQCPRQYIEAAHPNIVLIISTLINGLAVVFVGIATFRTLKNVQSPQNDRVEVLSL